MYYIYEKPIADKRDWLNATETEQEAQDLCDEYSEKSPWEYTYIHIIPKDKGIY